MRSYLRILQEPPYHLNQDKALTLVEVLVVVFIFGIISSAIFMVLNMGEFQNRIGSTRIAVQQDVRTVLNWLIRDMRQTSRGELNVTDEATGTTGSFVDVYATTAGGIFISPEFALCPGYGNPATEQISYGYDDVSQTLTRTSSLTGQVLTFHNITSLVFKTMGADTFNIEITGQRIAKQGPTGSIAQTINLNETVRMRNDDPFL